MRPIRAGIRIKRALFSTQENKELALFDLSTQTIEDIEVEAEFVYLRIVIYK